MAAANRVVETLIASGLIEPEYRQVAVEELHRELIRRSRRLSQALATMVAHNQFTLRFAEGVV